jgi:hypothetical protein
MIGARWLFGLTLVAGLLALIVVLDYTGYPYPGLRLLVFQYLLREQDIAGATLFLAIAVGAFLPRTRSGALAFVDALGRHPWIVAVITFVALCTATVVIALNHPLAGDEHLTLFQSRAFAAGRLTGELPPDLVFRLIPASYQWRWLIASETTGQVATIYWPGFALLLAPFSLVGAPWACNPLLASLSLVLMAKLAARLTGDQAAGGWAMLLALASPGFTGMALSYFSMTAHLFLNLLFAWLLVQGGTRRLAAAGVVGSLALVQSNPVPHILFALPWLAWIARRPHAGPSLAALAAGYAPLALGVGLGWWLFLRGLQPATTGAELFPSDDDPLHRLGNLLWHLHLQLRAVFMTPGTETLAHRVAEQARLWTWAAPGLPLLALAGWWLLRRVAEANVLALSLLTTLVGYVFVLFDQGYGWGARYVHSAWSVLPVLAGAAMVSLQEVHLRNYVVRLAVLSLVFGTALRFFQIRLFVEDHLTIRPPFEEDVRQIVFITPNFPHYSQDFVQNDPFLRNKVLFMTSRGLARDAELIERRFPGARKTYDGPNGQVWRLE